MSDFPHDVLTEILLRQPGDTLRRCMFVCKSWYSLITSPDFISLHINQTPNHLLIRYYTNVNADEPRQEHYSLRSDDGSPNFNHHKNLNFPFTLRQSIHSYFIIVGSCNGLICISNEEFSYNHIVYLWNPLIRKAVKAPKPSAFFQLRSFVVGFGFDSIRNDYKVLRIAFSPYKINRPEVEIYTLNSGYWRDITSKFKCKCIPRIETERSQQAYVNGASHWLAVSPVLGLNQPSPNFMILAFKWEEEGFSEMSFPGDLVGSEISLVVHKEFLSLFNVFSCGTSCTVWVMKEYGVSESWLVLLNIALPPVFDRPIGMTKNGGVLVPTSEGNLFSGHLMPPYFVDLGIRGSVESRSKRPSFYVGAFSESFVLLDKGAEFSDVVVSGGFSMVKQEANVRPEMRPQKRSRFKGMKPQVGFEVS